MALRGGARQASVAKGLVGLVHGLRRDAFAAVLLTRRGDARL